MNKYYHMGISISGALKKSDRYLDGIISKDGLELSSIAVRRILSEHAKKGYEIFAGCDNIDELGHCLGHERKNND